MIEDTPTVKIQSTSTTPGITTPPRSVVQVPMADDEPTDLGEVSVYKSLSNWTGDEEREHYWSVHTEDLNGSVVVKKPHDLVCMGLDVRLCT